MSNSRFDRLAGVRYNRRLRGVCLAASAISLFLLIVTALDGMVTGGPVKLDWILIFGIAFIISFAFAAYYHMRFLSRE
ncbi:hypothetical protein EHM69_10285 [candidate division KSB1 bacterium]|nr:MAG: hypothetical protein EHM69_10285 [candidate division KSB1 bacterium]